MTRVPRLRRGRLPPCGGSTATSRRWRDRQLEVRIDLGFYVHKEEKIRPARINAPELHDEVPYRMRKAKSARFQARKFCPEGAEITLQTTKAGRDRYARYIAEVLYKGENLSDLPALSAEGRRRQATS